MSHGKSARAGETHLVRKGSSIVIPQLLENKLVALQGRRAVLLQLPDRTRQIQEDALRLQTRDQSSGVDGTGRDHAYLLGVLRQPNFQLVGLLSLQYLEIACPLENAPVKLRAHRVDRLSELGSLRARLLRGRCKRGELCGESFDVVVGDIERRLEMLQGSRQLECGRRKHKGQDAQSAGGG